MKHFLCMHTGCFWVFYFVAFPAHYILKTSLVHIELTPHQLKSPQTVFTCHRRKSSGVNNQINDGWIPFSCFSFSVLVSFQLTGTLEKNRTIVNVISNTCAFPNMTSQKKSCCCFYLYWKWRCKSTISLTSYNHILATPGRTWCSDDNTGSSSLVASFYQYFVFFTSGSWNNQTGQSK